MTTKTLDRALYAWLGELLAYPGADYLNRVAAARDAVQEDYPEPAHSLGVFLGELEGKTRTELEESYTRTFDFAPLSAAYVSAHLFGDQSFRRSQLMAGLVAAYRRVEFDPGPELPDHLAVILRFAPHFSEPEWSDMAQYCLRIPAAKIREALERGGSPYRHVLGAVLQALDSDFPQESPHV